MAASHEQVTSIKQKLASATSWKSFDSHMNKMFVFDLSSILQWMEWGIPSELTIQYQCIPTYLLSNFGTVTVSTSSFQQEEGRKALLATKDFRILDVSGSVECIVFVLFFLTCMFFSAVHVL